MGKEVKIGLVVMGVLLCIFGGVLLLRLRPQKPALAARSKSAETKQSAKKSDKKTKAKINAGKHPPAFGAPRREPSDDASETADPFAADHAASDNRARDLASDDRHNARSDRYANTREAELESESDTSEVPDVADSPYGGQYGRHAFEPDEGLPVEDTPRYAASDSAQDESLMHGDHEDAGYRQTIFNGVDRYGQTSAGAMTDKGADTDDQFAEGSVAGPNGADQDEAVVDEEVVSDEASQPTLAFDRYRERSEYQLPSLSTNDPDVRPAVGNAIDDAEMPADDSSGAEDDLASQRATKVAPPRRLADAADGVYVVEANDNFWIISQKLYGTGAYFKALQEYNRPQSGEAASINLGDEIAAPSLDVLRESYPALCPKPHAPPSARGALARSGRSARRYTVAEGDTLFDIARHELGKASRWLEIYELNQDQLGDDFNYLTAGMQLQLPGDQPEPIVSRPRRDTFLR